MSAKVESGQLHGWLYDVIAKGRACERYWDGVVPSSLLNTAVKWLWLEKPSSSARSVMSSRSGSRSRARLRRSRVWYR